MSSFNRFGKEPVDFGYSSTCSSIEVGFSADKNDIVFILSYES